MNEFRVARVGGVVDVGISNSISSSCPKKETSNIFFED
jgi:hypothetical protein